MEHTTHNVLFLCADNSSRSIMAEAILNNLAVGKGRFKAYSAGRHPAQQINAFAFDQIRSAGLPSFGLQPKSWDEFIAPDAPRMHLTFVIGDDIAVDEFPTWPGDPLVAIWRVADPALARGTDVQKRRVFSQTFIYLYNRINILASLPLANLDRMGLQRRLDEIGTEGS